MCDLGEGSQTEIQNSVLSHIYLRHSLKVTSYKILNCFVHEIRFSVQKFSLLVSCRCLKVSGLGAFQVLGFGTAGVQSVTPLLCDVSWLPG